MTTRLQKFIESNLQTETKKIIEQFTDIWNGKPKEVHLDNSHCLINVYWEPFQACKETQTPIVRSETTKYRQKMQHLVGNYNLRFATVRFMQVFLSFNDHFENDFFSNDFLKYILQRLVIITYFIFIKLSIQVGSRDRLQRYTHPFVIPNTSTIQLENSQPELEMPNIPTLFVNEEYWIRQEIGVARIKIMAIHFTERFS